VTPPAVAASTETPAQIQSLAEQHLAVGRAHQAGGRLAEAIAAYRGGLESAAVDGSGPELVAELHAKLGNAWMLSGHLDHAADSYKAARCSRSTPRCWYMPTTRNFPTRIRCPRHQGRVRRNAAKKGAELALH